MFFFNDTATTEIYTLSLHDALPIYRLPRRRSARPLLRHHPGLEDRHLRRLGRHPRRPRPADLVPAGGELPRSEEHTSELQSRQYLVCRLLLEKKKQQRRSFFSTRTP